MEETIKSAKNTYAKSRKQAYDHFDILILFFIKIIHRPIQIQGKSRVDTWLRKDPMPHRQIDRLVRLQK